MNNQSGCEKMFDPVPSPESNLRLVSRGEVLPLFIEHQNNQQVLLKQIFGSIPRFCSRRICISGDGDAEAVGPRPYIQSMEFSRSEYWSG